MPAKIQVCNAFAFFFLFFFCKKLTRVDFASVLFRLDKSIRYVKNHKEVQQRFADAQRVAKPRTLIAIGGLQRWCFD
jgi:hypothetical protein